MRKKGRKPRTFIATLALKLLLARLPALMPLTSQVTRKSRAKKENSSRSETWTLTQKSWIFRASSRLPRLKFSAYVSSLCLSVAPTPLKKLQPKIMSQHKLRLPNPSLAISRLSSPVDSRQRLKQQTSWPKKMSLMQLRCTLERMG